MAWAYGSYTVGRLGVLVATAVLARLLTPEQFGLVALALVCIALLETLEDLGVTQALVVRSAEDDEASDTAFFTACALACALAAALALAAGPIGRAYEQPGLTPILATLALVFPIRAAASTHYAIAQRALDFRSRTAAEVAEVAVRGVTGIALAVAGAGAWSLVAGYLAGSAAWSAVLWVMVCWRPRRRWSRRELGGLVRFGGALTTVDLTAAYLSQVASLFIGATLGTAALGLYTIAWRLPALAVQGLAVVAGQVLYPAFAIMRADALSSAYVFSLRCTMLVVLPPTVLLGALSEEVLLAVFGAQWTGAAQTMTILTAFAAVEAMAFPAGTAYKATGRAWVLVGLAVPRAVILTVLLVMVTDQGLAAAASAQLVAAAAVTVAGTVLAGRLLGTGMLAIIQALFPPLLAGAGCLAAVLIVKQLLEGTWAVLVVGTGAGLGAYGVLVLLTARPTVRRVACMVRNRT